MRLTLALFLIGLTWLVWAVGAICIARHVEAGNTQGLWHADYPVCVTIHNGPLLPQRNHINLYPRRSDTA
jgi:hypothetical protein